MKKAIGCRCLSRRSIEKYFWNIWPKLFDELGGHAVSFSTFIGNESLAHLVQKENYPSLPVKFPWNKKYRGRKRQLFDLYAEEITTWESKKQEEGTKKKKKKKKGGGRGGRKSLPFGFSHNQFSSPICWSKRLLSPTSSKYLPPLVAPSFFNIAATTEELLCWCL